MNTNRSYVDAIKQCTIDIQKIRNVCILAHVDHGKTTIADSLLATNGLLSKRSAGQIRYLDDRRDEQERGITMKSSAVSLYYSLPNKKDLVLNLIDTPGHVDFSTEVSAAVRICDGALVVVDLVEGVCIQTRDAIKQAYDEHVKMILVLNKIDKLIVELHKNVEEIFQIILRVIEDCNASVAELCQYDIENEEQEETYLFSPEKGNVIFASAVDGWGVTTEQIASIFTDILVGENVSSLNSKLWNFDYYVESSTKRVVLGAIENKKENLFIQLCLKTIYHVYYTFITRMDRDKLSVVLNKLKIRNSTREMNHNDPRIQVKAIFQAWSPLAPTIMLQCHDIIPSPCDVSDRRLRHLVCGSRYYESAEITESAERMISNFRQNKASDDVPIVVYISKMFSAHKSNLSQNKPKIFIPTVRNRIPVTSRVILNPENKDVEKDTKKLSDESHNGTENDKYNNSNKQLDGAAEITSENVIIAFGRVFSGTLRKNQELYFLNSKRSAKAENLLLNKSDDIEKVVIKDLYLLLGRELVLVDSIPSGNICGLGGLETVVLRTGTLSSSLDCLPLSESTYMEPIVRNTIEPVNLKFLPQLRQGLKFLMQSDSCVKVITQETGEHVLVTAGDVHLAKCLEDLKSKCIDFDINVSKPMVSLRETIVGSSKNIEIHKDATSNVEITISDFEFILKVIIVSLPSEISKFIRINFQLLKAIEEHEHQIESQVVTPDSPNVAEKIFQNEHTRNLIKKLQEQIKSVFANCRGIWTNVWPKIWSIGKTDDSINLLFNSTEDYKSNIFTVLNQNDSRSYLDSYIVNGFEMACRAGPICEEPLMNCAFFITDYQLNNYSPLKQTDHKLQLVANVPSAVRTGFREAFEQQPQRLMEPIFTTDIQVTTNILGKVYSVISKRHGKVLDAIGMDEQEKLFLVKAQIPVIESDGFANEVRKTTSGQANPNLRFSHYEVIDGDPYYEPESDDEDDDDAKKAESAIRASRLMKETRRRKGLFVDDQIVVHAEKQRTLNKKK